MIAGARCFCSLTFTFRSARWAYLPPEKWIPLPFGRRKCFCRCGADGHFFIPAAECHWEAKSGVFRTCTGMQFQPCLSKRAHRISKGCLSAGEASMHSSSSDLGHSSGHGNLQDLLTGIYSKCTRLLPPSLAIFVSCLASVTMVWIQCKTGDSQ